jgi:uncharacterized membrane protein YfcA
LVPTEHLAATVIVAVGATLQGSIGFGLGMFSVPLLVLIDPAYVPGPLLLSSIVLTVLVTHRERAAIRFGDLKWAVGGRVLGIGIALVALTVVPADRIAVLFGTLVIGAVLLSASGLRVTVRPNTLFGAGILSGFMGTSVSIGGPPMALLYQRESGARLRGTLAAYFVVGVSLSIVGLALIGRFGRTELAHAVVLVPGVLVGAFVSRYTARVLDRGFIRTAVLVASAASAAAVLLRQFV